MTRFFLGTPEMVCRIFFFVTEYFSESNRKWPDKIIFWLVLERISLVLDRDVLEYFGRLDVRSIHTGVHSFLDLRELSLLLIFKPSRMFGYDL